MTTSGVEIEIKVAVPSVTDAECRLRAAGFEVSEPRVFESNQIYDWPDRSLRADKRLLRLRQVRDAFTLTYKGPPQVGGAAKHKTREEIEARTTDGTNMAAIMRKLGLEPSLRYDKYRTELRQPGQAGIAMLDETPIGVFIELEGPGEWIDAAARAMGFDESAYITASYATLFRSWCHAKGLAAGRDMVFVAP